MNKKRQLIAEEIQQTEEAYLKSLTILHTVIIDSYLYFNERNHLFLEFCKSIESKRNIETQTFTKDLCGLFYRGCIEIS